MIKRNTIDNNKETPLLSCGVEFNGKLYIASAQNNELYEYDCKTECLHYITCFEKEKDIPYLYRTCVVYKEKAWFIPQLAENIAVVDLNTFEIEYIPLKYKWIEDSVSLKCTAAGIYQSHYLYVIPCDIDSVILIDMDTKDIRTLDVRSNHEEKYSDAYYYNGYLYCIPWTADGILKINVATGETQQQEWRFGKKQYSQAIVDYEKEEVWFTPAAASKILKLNLKKNEWRTFPYGERKEECADDYIESFYGKIFNGKVFMFPFSCKEIISIDREKNSISRYDYHCEMVKIPFFKPIFSTKLIDVIEYTNQLLYYNEQRKCFEQRDLKLIIDKEFTEMRCKKMQIQINNNQAVKENYMVGFRQYIQYVIER